MDLLNSIITGLPVFIILLGPLMFIHELGHFWAAKAAGIRVEEFGMGFPPRALTLFKRGETTYTLNWLPIGAFVRMTGEEDPTDPRSFAAQPKRWRLITLAAGPFMNFIGAVLILTSAYFLFATQPTEFRYRIAAVNANSPAQGVGFLPGDEVVSVNGVDMTQSANPPAGQANTNTSNVSPLKQQAQASIGKTLTAVVLRHSNANDDASPAHEVTLQGPIPSTASTEAPLGVSLTAHVTKAERVLYTIPEAFQEALSDISNVIVGVVRAPIDLIAGRLAPEAARPVGVVGITNIGVTLMQEREVQGLFPFVRFAGLISLILGFTNLLPIPALDGGRILFVLIEWIRGRRIDPQREQWVHAIGMIVLLGLSAVIVVLDIVSPIRLR